MTLVLILVSLAAIALALTTVQVILVRRVRRRPFGPRPRPAGDFQPDGSSLLSLRSLWPAPVRVSVLKPLSGPEDGLAENLESFTRLEGISYEVILSVERHDDPAAEIARQVMAKHPEAPFRLVVGEGSRARIRNGKVDRLLAASRYATGDIFLVSDANVRVEPQDVARTVALFDDPSVGCVSNLFVGKGARSFGAIVESLHLLTFVVPGTAIAEAGGVPCVVGKSMALPQPVLESIGGFEAFLDVLAEDQAIGLAVRKAGFRVVLSPVVVRNVVVTRSLGRALDRQVRWGKIRFAFSAATYSTEILLNPLALVLAALVAGALLAPEFVPSLAAFALATAFARVLQAGVLARLTGARVETRHLLLMPVKDLLQVATQAVPYFSRHVLWHGQNTRIGPGSVLLPAGWHIPQLAPN
jgi:ceramide glucosyltransferase